MPDLVVQDRFFDLGGHSLLAVRVVAHIEKKFSRKLPVAAIFQHRTIEQLARAVGRHLALGLGTGVLVANPIPTSDELPAEACDRTLEQALADAERQGVRGRSVTPFLLERLRALSEGESVRANLALLRNNARVGAQLAGALAEAR